MRSEFLSRVPKSSLFYHTRELPLESLQALFLKVLTVLESLSPRPQNVKIVEDWLDHDGLEFEKGMRPLEFLFSIASTPRSLFEKTPKDHLVFLRAEAEDGSWIVRVHTAWDDEDRKQIGELHLVVAAAFASQIEAALQSDLYSGTLIFLSTSLPL